RLCPLLHTTESSRKADRLLVNIIGGTDLTLPMVNQIMTAINDLYGKDCHVIMGAVIDESLPQRIEVCVLGTTDLGGRGLMQRRLLAGARTNGNSNPPKAPPPKAAAPAAPAPDRAPAAAPPPKTEQNEFAFGEIESRGLFDKTDRNLFEGQDLDVPTYLRKGIKVAV
ncbi:MAG TPA: cell division protein FtsZ, partial [Opitutaceae bacterium]|nr:cell division protein FtsZ [Opitutaceae bacterium]